MMNHRLNKMKHPLTALPQMVALTQVPLLSWPIALPSANGASPGSNSSSNGSAALPPKVMEALQRECLKRNQLFLRGVNRYARSTAPGPQSSAKKSVVGQYGTLHLYPSADPDARRRPMFFCVPSLINKHYILDLTPETSLMQAINAMGFDAAMLEWPTPRAEQADKSVADYVIDMMGLLQEQWEHIDRSLIMLGYCMGGILATAVTQLFERVRGLVLLATPWDYAQYPLATLQPDMRERWRRQIQTRPLYHADAVQSLMLLVNNDRLYKRFCRFAEMTDPEEMQHFVALEHWANDGMPLTQTVAEECLLDWPQNNPLAQGRWQVEDVIIRPEAIRVPVLAALPRKDAIVPEAVARPLAEALQDCTIATPCGGHVGMVAGTCRHELHKALQQWLFDTKIY